MHAVCLYVYANCKFTTLLKNSTQPSIYPLHLKLDMAFHTVVDHKNGADEIKTKLMKAKRCIYIYV